MKAKTKLVRRGRHWCVRINDEYMDWKYGEAIEWLTLHKIGYSLKHPENGTNVSGPSYMWFEYKPTDEWFDYDYYFNTKKDAEFFILFFAQMDTG